ncbi:MAG: outer membrane lipid asymmetry maintenance protein MlaD, partial [Rhodobacteraceae bacterium]|nr:outer membrane lipid asymmetry maintenance protein MlaD [Paracoccaceae bacterium]
EGLLGGSFIEVIPGASFDYLEAGDEIIDTQGSVSLIQLLLKFVSSGQN